MKWGDNRKIILDNLLCTRQRQPSRFIRAKWKWFHLKLLLMHLIDLDLKMMDVLVVKLWGYQCYAIIFFLLWSFNWRWVMIMPRFNILYFPPLLNLGCVRKYQSSAVPTRLWIRKKLRIFLIEFNFWWKLSKIILLRRNDLPKCMQHRTHTLSWNADHTAKYQCIGLFYSFSMNKYKWIIWYTAHTLLSKLRSFGMYRWLLCITFTIPWEWECNSR